jgi:hypothetical protein
VGGRRVSIFNWESRAILDAQFFIKEHQNIDDGMLHHLSRNAMVLIDQVQKQKQEI